MVCIWIVSLKKSRVQGIRPSCQSFTKFKEDQSMFTCMITMPPSSAIKWSKWGDKKANTHATFDDICWQHGELFDEFHQHSWPSLAQLIDLFPFKNRKENWACATPPCRKPPSFLRLSRPRPLHFPGWCYVEFRQQEKELQYITGWFGTFLFSISYLG